VDGQEFPLGDRRQPEQTISLTKRRRQSQKNPAAQQAAIRTLQIRRVGPHRGRGGEGTGRGDKPPERVPPGNLQLTPKKNRQSPKVSRQTNEGRRIRTRVRKDGWEKRGGTEMTSQLPSPRLTSPAYMRKRGRAGESRPFIRDRLRNEIRKYKSTDAETARTGKIIGPRVPFLTEGVGTWREQR